VFDRARLSLGSLGYSSPIVGFSWDSDTKISNDGWNNAQIIAKENGPKLAQFVVDLKEKCPQIKIRMIAHSLGARVVLSSLDSLNYNQARNSGNFHVESVHLMGAAVNRNEVSKNAADIVSRDGIHSSYGKAIEEEVLHFYNLVNREDDALEPGLYNAWLLPTPYAQWNFFENQPVYYLFMSKN
jgi:esterase/lipase superfamily enzyme